jgi:hypothetical protein
MIGARTPRSVPGAMHLHPHLAKELMRSTERRRLAEGTASRAAAHAAKAMRTHPLAPRRDMTTGEILISPGRGRRRRPQNRPRLAAVFLAPAFLRGLRSRPR